MPGKLKYVHYCLFSFGNNGVILLFYAIIRFKKFVLMGIECVLITDYNIISYFKIPFLKRVVVGRIFIICCGECTKN